MSNFTNLFEGIQEEFKDLDIQGLKEGFKRRIENQKGPISNKDKYNQLALMSIERLDKEETGWTFVAARFLKEFLYEEAKNNRGSLDFHSMIKILVDEKVYDPYLLNEYTKEEIDELGKTIDFEKDNLFNYVGLKTLADSYLKTTKDGKVIELPQERYMIIAMSLMKNEKDNRLEKIKESYWALSNQYMITATPTLSNAGTLDGQLSSCFIDTVEDDLRSIYDSNTDIAEISKNGGGVGVYMGKVRALGSSIRGHKGVSGGVIPWMKQLDTTAVNVDQLGKRKGAISIYLDVWHKDIMDFLDVRLNNGDPRKRARDIFTGICIPNIFFEAVEKRDNWYLFDPYEIREKMGFSLEDYFDESKTDGTFRKKYQECIDNPELDRIEIPAIDIMKRVMISQLETGTPFMFYRDTVNQLNANSHEGMIYCSNLCTEITQNQSPTYVTEEYIQEDGKIITVRDPGDLVVCNLSSINLARAYQDGVLERLVPIQVRMLDNTIDINNLPLPQAEVTNKKYRAVGLGTFGYHHLLVLNSIHWESEEAVEFSDKLYEKIAYLSIKASMELSKEKGRYPLFNGSDWETGAYFEKRGYLSGDSEYDWEALMEDVKEHGMRNSYLMAVAPNATTSIISGSTASIDPVYQVEYAEEKKNYRIPVTAPDYSEQTKEFYKTAFDLDQTWSLKQNAVRQKHIDQSISFNFYVNNSVRAVDLLNYHLTAWKLGLKTTYYVRSNTK